MNGFPSIIFTYSQFFGVSGWQVVLKLNAVSLTGICSPIRRYDYSSHCILFWCCCLCLRMDGHNFFLGGVSRLGELGFLNVG